MFRGLVKAPLTIPRYLQQHGHRATYPDALYTHGRHKYRSTPVIHAFLQNPTLNRFCETLQLQTSLRDTYHGLYKSLHTYFPRGYNKYGTYTGLFATALEGHMAKGSKGLEHLNIV